MSLGVSWKKIAAPTSMASRGPRSKHPHHSRQCPKSLETLARDAKDGAGGPSLPPAHHHSGQWERREKTGLALRGPLCSPTITVASGRGGRKLVSRCGALSAPPTITVASGRGGRKLVSRCGALSAPPPSQWPVGEEGENWSHAAGPSLLPPPSQWPVGEEGENWSRAAPGTESGSEWERQAGLRLAV